MAQIGLKNLYYAPITEDGAGRENYGEPVKIADAISADLSVNNGDATLYGDDKVYAEVRDFTGATIALAVCDLPSAIVTALMGARIDDNGVLISSQEDAMPPVAIGFESKCADGESRYFWLYRVTFAPAGAQLRTKGESIEFSTPTIEGKITRRNRMDAQGKRPWKTENKAETSAEASEAWFENVYEEDVDAIVGMITVTPKGSTETLPLIPEFDSFRHTYRVSLPSGTAQVNVALAIIEGATATASYINGIASITVAYSADEKTCLCNGLVVQGADGVQITSSGVTYEIYWN